MEAAQNFKPENPSFTALIGRRNLTRRYLNVPALFWRVHVGKISPMKLQDSNGQKWAINFHRAGAGSIRIGKGWIRFARANGVKEGDVCVFELIRRKNFGFRVTIFAS
ncbi:B3 domain-containing protein REM19-like [Prosopis cineraria]|uniref:B3 domain-containing protein REM19-like n=1 Tax=Prosopis cineraria TaxID=364024 RepID=UPI00240E9DBC|nr:B3 domain-containing protein REM19-like [Prosopis cineraria]